MTRLLVVLLAFGFAGVIASADSPKPGAEPTGKTPKDVCVKPCKDCAAECAAAVKHGHEKKMDEHMIHAMEVCHHACLTCSHAVSSKNANSWAACELCEKVCLDCAAHCEKSDDAHMKKCAQMCRDCAKACAEARK